MLARQIIWQGRPIGSWADFHEIVKRPEQRLLARLDEYDDTLLVAGCQRSGTTAVARMLKRVPGIADHAFGHDDELDGALLLAGYVERFTHGRHCFQTTYLNDRFPEYYEHGDYRLIWMLREPRSVVYSMLHNWKRGALNRLYDACGARRLPPEREERSLLSTLTGPSRLDKACASYLAKTEQTFALRDRLGARMAIVDYDELVQHKDELLPRLCEFAEVPYDAELARHLHGRSVHKGDKLADWQSERVEAVCRKAYEAAREQCTIGVDR